MVTDRKNAVDIGIWVPSTKSFNTGSTDNRLDYYVADVVEVTDYYPGGMPMPGRSVLDMQFQSFKWGHNGQYNDDEIYGKGNTQMAEFWEYDARLMRRWNTDPMAHAGQSLYEAFYSNPIAFADPLGLKPEGGGGSIGPDKKGKQKKYWSIGKAKEAAEEKARELVALGYKDVQVVPFESNNGYFITYDRIDCIPIGEALREDYRLNNFMQFASGVGDAFKNLGTLAYKLVKYSPAGTAYRDVRKGNYWLAASNGIPYSGIIRHRDVIAEKAPEAVAGAVVSTVTMPFQGLVFVNHILDGDYRSAGNVYGENLINGASWWVGLKMGGVGNPNPNTTGTLVETVSSSTESAAAKGGTTTVYRNFGWNEYKALRASGNNFEIGSNFGSKQFWLDKEGINWWNSTSFSKNFTAKITVNNSALKQGTNFLDARKYRAISFDSQEALNIFNKNMKIEWIQYK